MSAPKQRQYYDVESNISEEEGDIDEAIAISERESRRNKP
jgi:hypothetical protein